MQHDRWLSRNRDNIVISTIIQYGPSAVSGIVTYWGLVSELPPPAVFSLGFGVLAAAMGLVRLLQIRGEHSLAPYGAPASVSSPAASVTQQTGGDAPRWGAWLDGIADGDKEHLPERIPVTHARWDTTGLRAPEPYVDFELTLFNGSVFTIFLTGAVGGRIRYGDDPLQSQPEVRSPVIHDRSRGSTRFDHGATFRVALRQFLSPALAKYLRDLPLGFLPVFAFDQLAIEFGATNDNDSQRPHLMLGTYSVDTV